MLKPNRSWAKTTPSNNLHLRFEDLQLREDVLLYPGVRCGCESHHWNRRKLLAKHIHPFVILTKIMTPLIGKKYCSRLSVSLFCEGQHWSIERKHFTLPWGSRLFTQRVLRFSAVVLSTTGGVNLLMLRDKLTWLTQWASSMTKRAKSFRSYRFSRVEISLLLAQT